MTRQPNSSHWIPPMLSIPEVIPRSRRLKSRRERKLVNTIVFPLINPQIDFFSKFFNSDCLT